ncbi:DUF3992 domain-containing protein [Cytobacillus firmus]|uniref:DUF3992 domain-containing protein n=1 Tax=Cytobacillus firmus TaxID=1399 RepID=UPI003001E37B
MCSSCNSMCCCCPDENGGNGGNGAVRPILTDQFCCNFELNCDATPGDERFVWRSRQGDQNIPVAGTVSVSYIGGCADPLQVNIRLGGENGTIVGQLFIPEQSGGPGNLANCQSITLQQFDTLEIICSPGTGQGNDCEGEFCLTIHYPSPFPLV